MNKQFLISVVVMFVATMLTGFIVHGALLGAEYKALTALYRSEEEQMNYFHYMLLAHLLLSIGLTWIYRMCRDDSAWIGQGLKFGAAVAVLMTMPMFLIYYSIQPMPGMLVVKQIAFDTVGMLLLGMLLAVLNRK